MAGVENIFGTTGSPEFERQEREAELYERERPYVQSDQRYNESLPTGMMTTTERRNRRSQPRRDAQQRVQQQMQVKSPEQQQAELSQAVSQSINSNPNFRNGVIAPKDRTEETLKVAIREADKLGMQSESAKFAEQLDKMRAANAKTATAQELLEAQTTTAQNKARESQTYLKTGTNSDGDEYETEIDRQTGKEISTRITKPGEWKSIRMGATEWGMQKGDKIIKSQATTEAEQEEEFKKLRSQMAAIDQVKNNIRNVNKALGANTEGDDPMINWSSTGQIGKILSEYGALEPISSGDARTLKGILTQVKSALSLGKLQELKKLSSTGASGLGQVSKIEIELLMDNLESVDQFRNPAELRESLEQISKHWKRLQESIEASLNLDSIDWKQPGYSDYVETRGGRRFLNLGPGHIYEMME
jgi:hypothetical protein